MNNAQIYAQPWALNATGEIFAYLHIVPHYFYQSVLSMLTYLGLKHLIKQQKAN